MTQVPFWLDWNFWEVVVLAIGALLGFLGGTTISHRLEQRRQDRLRTETVRTLAIALHAEISTIRAKCIELLKLLGRSSGVAPGEVRAGRAIGIPKAVIYEANASLLGNLPPDLCGEIVQFYGIRDGTEGLLDAADEHERAVLLSWLTRLSDAAVKPLTSLDGFLGRPPQLSGKGAFEPVADLPVRNTRPAPAPPVQ